MTQDERPHSANNPEPGGNGRQVSHGVHRADTPENTVPAGDGEPVGNSDRGAASETAYEQVPALRPLTAPVDDDDDKAGEPYEQ